jgi:hypothetical protein
MTLRRHTNVTHVSAKFALISFRSNIYTLKYSVLQVTGQWLLWTRCIRRKILIYIRQYGNVIADILVSFYSSFHVIQ